MPTKKKRLTQREKAERAAMKKQLQAEGVLPPDKPRLNRKKFARETWAEWEEFLKGDPIRAEVSLLRAVEFIAGPELPAVTPEQVGVYKALKLAVEYNTNSSASWKPKGAASTQSGSWPTRSSSPSGNYKEANNTS